MRHVIRRNERLAWTAAVVTLATSASWLAAINVVLLARQAGLEAPAALVVGRALARAAWLMVRHGAPIAPLALVVLGLVLLFVRTLRRGTPLERGARHA
jgi:hypothetical protein